MILLHHGAGFVGAFAALPLALGPFSSQSFRSLAHLCLAVPSLDSQFKEPRLLIVTDPRTDHQPIREASYMGIPVIAFCDSDSPLRHVDLAIPANNKGRYSIGLLYWLLAREVLRLRGTIERSAPWDVAVDLFFYREPEELKQLEEGEKAAAEPATYEEPAAYDGAAVPEADFTTAPADFGAQQQWSEAGAAEQWGAAAAPAY